MQVDERFRERDLASPTHIFTPEEHAGAMDRVFTDTSFAFPGGESNQQVLERGLQALNDLLTDHAGQKVAVGIHGNIMTILMGHFDSRYDVEFWRKLEKPDIYKLVFHDGQYVHAERIWQA